MLEVYQETVRSILDQSDHPGISAEELELFKSQFRTSAYTCRLKACPRATLGFEMDKACLDHELAHVRKFRCTFPDCHFPPFVSAQALKGHANKYHNPNPAPKSIRNVRTSPAQRRAPSRHDEDGDKPLRKRRKQSPPRFPANSNATQPEENGQALDNPADRPLMTVRPSDLPMDVHSNKHQPGLAFPFPGEFDIPNPSSDAIPMPLKPPSPEIGGKFLELPLFKGGLYPPELWQSSYEVFQGGIAQAAQDAFQGQTELLVNTSSSQQNNPEEVHAIGGLFADWPDDQQRQVQFEPLVNIYSRHIEESLDDTSDEALRDYWGRNLDLDIYDTLAGLMELPVFFPRAELNMPLTFKRWEDFWPWMKRHPEFTERFEFLADLQFSQFKRKLLQECFRPDGSLPIFEVSQDESHRVRNTKRWQNDLECNITSNIMKTKMDMWMKIKDSSS